MRIACIILTVVLLMGCHSPNAEASSIDNLIQKQSIEYTVDDCRLLLSTDLVDLADVFGFDLADQPNAGQLLTGDTLATPVIALVDQVLITYSPQDVSSNSVVIYGHTGEQTMLEDFVYGAILEEGHDTIDTFYKLCEGCESSPAKRIEIIDGDLLLEVNYEFGDNAYTLNNIRVSKSV